ncbi:hypothetical protein MBLNU459_g1269t1 [Dothideomycetes sp. NU459]
MKGAGPGRWGCSGGLRWRAELGGREFGLVDPPSVDGVEHQSVSPSVPRSHHVRDHLQIPAKKTATTPPASPRPAGADAAMISDASLYSLAIFLGSVSMLLIVLYHFLEVNAAANDAEAPLSKQRRADAVPAKPLKP